MGCRYSKKVTVGSIEQEKVVMGKRAARSAVVKVDHKKSKEVWPVLVLAPGVFRGRSDSRSRTRT